MQIWLEKYKYFKINFDQTHFINNSSVVPWLLPPNAMICAARHFLHPLAMVLCFSILLVKAMQLRSLITIGLGGKIPQSNQIISLIFMFAVQVSII